MTNSKSDISVDISVKGQKLEELTNFKYRGITSSKDGTCSEDIHNRTARLHKGCLSLLSSPSSSFSARHGPCLLTPRKGSRLSRPGYFSASPTWSVRPTTGCRARPTPTWSVRPTSGCGARPTPFWGHKNLFQQLSKEETHMVWAGQLSWQHFLFCFWNSSMSHWGFSLGKFGSLSPGKASCNSHATKPVVYAGFVCVSIIH